MIIGYIIPLLTMNISGRYISLFLMASGSCGTCFLALLWPVVPLLRTPVLSAYPLTLAWLATAVPRPPAKRSAAIGLTNGFGNLGTLYVVIVPPILSIRFIDDLLTAWRLTLGNRAGVPSTTNRWLLGSVHLRSRLPSVLVCI